MMDLYTKNLKKLQRNMLPPPGAIQCAVVDLNVCQCIYTELEYFNASLEYNSNIGNLQPIVMKAQLSLSQFS